MALTFQPYIVCSTSTYFSLTCSISVFSVLIGSTLICSTLTCSTWVFRPYLVRPKFYRLFVTWFEVSSEFFSKFLTFVSRSEITDFPLNSLTDFSQMVTRLRTFSNFFNSDFSRSSILLIRVSRLTKFCFTISDSELKLSPDWKKGWNFVYYVEIVKS